MLNDIPCIIKEGDVISNTLALRKAVSVEQINDIMTSLDKVDLLDFDEAKIEAGRQACLQIGLERIKKETLNEIKRGEASLRKKNPIYRIRRFGLIVVTFILLTGFIAYASGSNLFKLFENFGNGRNQIGFSRGVMGDNGGAPVANTELDEDMMYDNIADALKNISFKPNIPSYVSDDLELLEVKVKQISLETRMHITYRGVDDFLLVMIVKPNEVSDIDIIHNYDEDYDLLERIEIDNVEIYIMSDGNVYHIIWFDKGILYRINTNKELDEVMKIQKSFQ